MPGLHDTYTFTRTIVICYEGSYLSILNRASLYSLALLVLLIFFFSLFEKYPMGTISIFFISRIHVKLLMINKLMNKKLNNNKYFWWSRDESSHPWIALKACTILCCYLNSIYFLNFDWNDWFTLGRGRRSRHNLCFKHVSGFPIMKGTARFCINGLAESIF